MNEFESLETALLRLKYIFSVQYGIEDAVLKLGLSHEGFDALVQHVFNGSDPKNRRAIFRPSDLPCLEFVGVQIKPTKKEAF